MTHLVADIGGTNARFALAENGRLIASTARTLAVAEYATPGAAIAAYRREHLATLKSAVIAAAGPVSGNRCQLTNAGWLLDGTALSTQLGVSVQIVNDFHAQAASVPSLTDDELTQVGTGERKPGNYLILGPGTGLGVAFGLAEADHWHIQPGEGGHVGFAPADAFECELLKAALKDRGGRVSAEFFCCGDGLANLYRLSLQVAGMSDDPLPQEQIVAAARAAPSGFAAETVRRFGAVLGSFAGDRALMTDPRFGVYIGGGVTGHIQDFLLDGPLAARFRDKGRVSPMIADVPLYLTRAENQGLRGAAALTSGDFT